MMTFQQFNKKYKKFIPEGWYGLEFDIPEVTEYLDFIIEGLLCDIPGFEIHQIKLKFGYCRFYAEVDVEYNESLWRFICSRIEQRVNLILKKLKENDKE